MDQFDAFGYFITNLMLHNLVLVVLAVVLGLVLGRLAFGASKASLEKLGEALKAAEMRADAADRDLEKLRSQDAGLADGSGVAGSDVAPLPELAVLLREKEELGAKLVDVAARMEGLVGRVDGLEREKADLEERLKKSTPAAADGKAGEDLEKLRASIKGLEQRVAEADGVAEAREKRIQEAIEEREQVEKASAVLRKEMRGLRNRMKEIEQQELQVAGLESALHDAEERLARSQATVAKESRMKASLEKMVEDLEWQLSELRGGREAGPAGSGIDPVPEAPEARAEPGVGAESGASSPGPTGREGTAPADSPDPDGEELLRIKGVGSVLVRRLRDRGVTTLRQIADWSDEDLAEISSSLRLGTRPERGNWRGQARALCGDD